MSEMSSDPIENSLVEGQPDLLPEPVRSGEIFLYPPVNPVVQVASPIVVNNTQVVKRAPINGIFNQSTKGTGRPLDPDEEIREINITGAWRLCLDIANGKIEKGVEQPIA